MRRYASHSVVCDAPAQRVYELVSRACDWPRILQPCEEVTVLATSDDEERVEIVALLRGVRATWESQRRFKPEIYGVDAEIVRPMPLVEYMRASWRVVDLENRQCLLLVEHDYRVSDDVSGLVDGVTTRIEAERFIAEAIDLNSTRELHDFKAAAERFEMAPREAAGV